MAQKTSDLILNVASKLFSEKGFSGTSVREIAKKANVNLSAISYHFKNKENLFFHVFSATHAKFEKMFGSISRDLPLADFMIALYEKLSCSHTSILNIFRMFLTQEIKMPVDTAALPLLPPGGQVIFEIITKEMGSKVPKPKRYWLTFVFFQRILFMAFFKNLKLMKKNIDNYQDLVNLNEKEDIKLFVKSFLKK